MNGLDDAELQRLFEAAERSVGVDRSVRAHVWAQTMAVYRAVANGDDPGTDPHEADAPEPITPGNVATVDPGRSRRRLASIAAVLLVVVAGAVGWQLAERRRPTATTATLPTPAVHDTTVPPTATSPSVPEAPVAPPVSATEESATMTAAEALGQEFMSARAAYDSDALLELLAPDATFADGELAVSLDEYELQSEWEQIVGWQFLDPVCTASSPQRVLCSYSVQDAFNEAAGKGPFPGNGFLLGIEDGHIVSVSHILTTDLDFFVENEVQFYAWIRENHPDDLALMLDGDRLMGGANRTFIALNDDSIRLWKQHTAEYLASVATND